MPTVVNGIGTWYYGKRRIHARKGTCPHCRHSVDLTSYDTTLFFVVFFIPVVPLAHKRILEQCAVCGKHRVCSLRKWEEAKVSDGVRVLDEVHNNPNDRDAVLRAISFAQAYQDEPLFNQVMEPLADAFKDDAAVQAQLGDAYAYFARWPQAEAAYRASLAVQDNDAVRQAVGWALLKQGRPDEAEPFLRHILDQRQQQAAGVIFYFIQAYQAQGRHEEALALMDRRDEAFPDLAASKDCRKQRQTSVRYRGTDRKVRSAILDERGKAGYRHGSWTARLPGWIAGALVVGALALYLIAAFWIGQARKVYLVNGTDRAYSVVVEGTEHSLLPGRATAVRLAEGDITVAFRDALAGLEPVHAHIETSFWGRPFTSPVFIVNPDRAALILQEETVYAAVAPPPGPPPHVHFGQAVYEFPSADYVFQEFPANVPVKGNETVRKTRVALAPLGAEGKLNLMLVRLHGAEQVDFCKRLLRVDPGQSFFLFWLQSQLAPEAMLEFLQAHLEDRPPVVQWHRAYQSLMEQVHPETDLRPRYRQLVAANKGNADAVYLLGRAEPDLDAGDKLFRQAAAATPPSGYAMYALAYRDLGEGKFAEGAAWLEKAWPLFPDKTLLRPLYYDALLAHQDYDRLLQLLTAQTQTPGSRFTAWAQISRVNALQGHKEQARAALAQAVQLAPVEGRQAVQRALEGVLCCCEGDVAGFLKSVADTAGPPSFEAALLRGQLQEAAAQAKQGGPDAGVLHALLYLAAVRAGDKGLADAQWQELLRALAKGQRDERHLGLVLAGKEPLAAHPPERLLIDCRRKRVFLAVLAQRFPDRAQGWLELARRLDFQRDAISLCLRQLTGQKKE
jgi:tetratricopeptide (TPR) repeat protein